MALGMLGGVLTTTEEEIERDLGDLRKCAEEAK